VSKRDGFWPAASDLVSLSETVLIFSLTKIIRRSSSVAEAQSLQSCSRFDKLDASLQAFVSQLAQGNIDDVEHIRSLASQNGLDDKLRSRENLIQSLKFGSMNQRATSINNAHLGTFKWIFFSNLPAWAAFVSWLPSDEKLYWISGKPGSGKSTLMKFIVADAHTTRLLRADTVIVSHYFWNAGEEMQKSVKGLLLTVLHRLLCEEPELADHPLNGAPKRGGADKNSDCRVGIGRKDNHNDWSSSELRHWMVRILSLYPRPVCMFLDGADEISPADGPTELMDLVQELLGLQNVKVCISSRPDPAFKNWLGAYPMLRLQDLTNQDIRDVCSATLAPLFSNDVADFSAKSLSNSTEICRLLVDDLTDKAEGVFLWVHLALKSVQRGQANAECRSDILRRIRLLPAGLEALYSSMWERVNDDRGVHERKAALYLGLVIDARKLQDWGIFKHWSAVSVLEFMVASNISLQDFILSGGLNEPDPLTCREVEDMCALMVKDIESSCGGFLEVGPYGQMENPLGREYGTGSRWDSLVPWTNTSVAFIHRTASDFFTDTESGRTILEKHPSSRDDRLTRLYRSSLVQLTLWAIAPTSYTIAARPSDKVDSLVWDMFRFRHIMMGIGMSISEPVALSKTLSSCEWFWNTMQAKKKQDVNGRQVDFLALAARGGYYPFVASRLLGTALPSSNTCDPSLGSDSAKLLSGYKVLLVQWLQQQGTISRAFECEFFSWTYSPHISLASAAPTLNTLATRRGRGHAASDGIEIHARFVPDMESPKTTLQACAITNKVLSHGYSMDSRVTFHVFPGREKLYPGCKRRSTAAFWGHDDGVQVIVLEINIVFLLFFLQGLLQADWPGAMKTKTLELDILKSRRREELRMSVRCVNPNEPAKELDAELVLRCLVDMFAWCSSPKVRRTASEALIWSCMSFEMYARIFD